MPPSGERPIVRKPLGEAHADRRSNRRRQTHQERHPRITGSKSRREERRQRRNRPVHQPYQARLHHLQHEILAVPEIVISRPPSPSRSISAVTKPPPKQNSRP